LGVFIITDATGWGDIDTSLEANTWHMIADYIRGWHALAVNTID
jgi:hypothetical protein